jgi:hypothetical protein
MRNNTSETYGQQSGFI